MSEGEGFFPKFPRLCQIPSLLCLLAVLLLSSTLGAFMKWFNSNDTGNRYAFLLSVAFILQPMSCRQTVMNKACVMQQSLLEP